MSISPISAAGLSQYVLSTNSNQLQQTLQTLQNSLASGDLNVAQSAFQTLQALTQNSETANGSATPANSQLSTDLGALGSALTAGDLSTAQSAFVTVQGDLKSPSSPALANEINAASQSVQLVQELLSTVNSGNSASSATDLTTSLLESAYGGKGLNVLG